MTRFFTFIGSLDRSWKGQGISRAHTVWTWPWVTTAGIWLSRQQNGPIVDNSTINGTVDEASIAMSEASTSAKLPRPEVKISFQRQTSSSFAVVMCLRSEQLCFWGWGDSWFWFGLKLKNKNVGFIFHMYFTRAGQAYSHWSLKKRPHDFHWHGILTWCHMVMT